MKELNSHFPQTTPIQYAIQPTCGSHRKMKETTETIQQDPKPRQLIRTACGKSDKQQLAGGARNLFNQRYATTVSS